MTGRGYSRGSPVYTHPSQTPPARWRIDGLGSALVLACGGDGTVHEVVQGLAGTGVPLGVLPLGTANALARNLGLPVEPVRALERLLSFTPQSIPLGELSTAAGTRWFTVMAGCGPDGALVHTLPRGAKALLGRAAYYGHAARLFATRQWPAFRVEYRVDAGSDWRDTEAVALMASRVPDLGGLFSGLTPGASLHHPHLHVHLLRGPAHLSLPAWFAMRQRNPLLTTLDVAEVRCTPLGAGLIYAQADAEGAGTLPVSLRIVPDALTLLMP